MMKLHFGSSYVDVKDRNFKVIKPGEVEGIKDLKGDIELRLDHPTGTNRLEDMVQGKRNVVIVVNDISRPCPVNVVLPPLIDYLNNCGIDDEKITVVFGLGTHRNHTDEEKKELVGPYVYSKVRCIDHDTEDCIYLGESSYGTPIEIFSEVASADFIICISGIEYHYFVGYSGGLKNIMPGVSSIPSILANHRVMFREGSISGNLESPARKDIEEIGTRLGVDFILNVVLNGEKEVAKVVAGDPILAHREGISTVDSIFRAKVEPREVVLSSAYPKDLSLYQAHKALENAGRAVKDGGSVILIAECRDGLGSDTFKEWLFEASSPYDVMVRFEKAFTLGGHKAYAFARLLQRIDVYLYSKIDGVERQIAFKKGFFKPCENIDETLEELISKHEAEDVLVMPFGGSTLVDGIP